MAADLLQKQRRRGPGRPFEKGRSGNPAGREPGTRNRATVLAEQLFDSECGALVRKATAMALGGDAAVMRLCLDRIIAPRRERPVRVTLPPIHGAADLVAAMAAVTAAAAEGVITTGEAFELAQVVDTFVRAIEAGEFERRLERLESLNGVAA